MPFNFAIENELTENNQFRLKHLNYEERNKLTKILFEFNDIQYKESENLTFTSTIKFKRNQNR